MQVKYSIGRVDRQVKARRGKPNKAGGRAPSWKFKTAEELKAAGYVFLGTGICRSDACRAVFEWWQTPEGKRIPIDGGTHQAHWATCADAESFRRIKFSGEPKEKEKRENER